jgi:hypothetical protein
MRTSAHYSSHSSSPLPFSALQDRYFDDELVAGERIGAPLRRSRIRRLLRTLLITALVAGAGYAVVRDPAAWWQRAQWLGAQAGSLVAFLETKTASHAEPSSRNAPPHLEPLATEPIKQASVQAGQPIEMAAPARAEPSEAVAFATPGVEPLPPVVVDPNDPYQRRAEAVGLHPGLSRVLLARLSAEDYRNAEYAINTAIAKTTDGSVFAWPRQRISDLALFKVHFVRGVTPDCRRYVVTVAKDGWVTTALPMERCGPNLRQAMRK